MRLGDYYRGRSLELATRLPPDEVEGRINAAAASIFAPFATGVVGWARFGRLRLRYRASLIRNDAKPILAGRIRPDRGGALLHLNYRGPLPLLVFFPFWYAMLVLMAAVYLTAPGAGTDSMPGFVFPLILALFLLMPAAMLYLGLAKADADLEEMLTFLRTNLAAHDVAARPI